MLKSILIVTFASAVALASSAVLAEQGKQSKKDQIHRFTRDKMVKEYKNAAVPPARITGPVIYSMRWFDNSYGGRR